MPPSNPKPKHKTLGTLGTLEQFPVFLGSPTVPQTLKRFSLFLRNQNGSTKRFGQKDSVCLLISQAVRPKRFGQNRWAEWIGSSGSAKAVRLKRFG
ncbi:hypothetical protein FVE85_3403 [Porphyridium purpureum]|uniref:Uncharacterized protein n=1 Tax=Porphyridium purpureum TaxID=35688 RepID=A0A5J4YWF2_PORPP|nr:hypothetical protein FVE85_3403 [Porphyridium purpureum]|eukprot:POR8208..scf227_4